MKNELKPISTRVPKEIKKMFDDEAHRQDVTMQVLLQKMVIQYLNKASYSSKIEALSLENRETIEKWAMAVKSGDPFAINVLNTMEFCNERIEREGSDKGTR